MDACEAQPKTVNKDNSAEVRAVEVVAADEQGRRTPDKTAGEFEMIVGGRAEGFAAVVEDSNLETTAVAVGDLGQAVPDKHCF